MAEVKLLGIGDMTDWASNYKKYYHPSLMNGEEAKAALNTHRLAIKSRPNSPSAIKLDGLFCIRSNIDGEMILCVTGSDGAGGIKYMEYEFNGKDKGLRINPRQQPIVNVIDAIRYWFGGNMVIDGVKLTNSFNSPLSL